MEPFITGYFLIRNLQHHVIGVVKSEWIGGNELPGDRFTISGHYDRYYESCDEKLYNREVNNLTNDQKRKR